MEAKLVLCTEVITILTVGNLKKLIKIAFVVLNSTQHAPYSSTVQAKQKRQLPQRYL